MHRAPSTHLTRKAPFYSMAQKLKDTDLVTFKELLIANSIQVDTLAQLLRDKGFISREESLR